jgi:hypothetical protein
MATCDTLTNDPATTLLVRLENHASLEMHTGSNSSSGAEVAVCSRKRKQNSTTNNILACQSDQQTRTNSN